LNAENKKIVVNGLLLIAMRHNLMYIGRWAIQFCEKNNVYFAQLLKTPPYVEFLNALYDNNMYTRLTTLMFTKMLNQIGFEIREQLPIRAISTDNHDLLTWGYENFCFYTPETLNLCMDLGKYETMEKIMQMDWKHTERHAKDVVLPLPKIKMNLGNLCHAIKTNNQQAFDMFFAKTIYGDNVPHYDCTVSFLSTQPMCMAAKYNRVTMAQLLKDNGFVVGTEVRDMADINSSQDFIKWFNENYQM
jgi:hypothetical protein